MRPIDLEYLLHPLPLPIEKLGDAVNLITEPGLRKPEQLIKKRAKPRSFLRPYYLSSFDCVEAVESLVTLSLSGRIAIE